MNPIDEAAAVYELAKMQHERTAEALADAHSNLVALMPTKDEGAVTVSGESYKVAITYGMNRTVDAAALAAIKDSVPVALFEQARTNARQHVVRILALENDSLDAVQMQQLAQQQSCGTCADNRDLCPQQRLPIRSPCSLHHSMHRLFAEMLIWNN